MGRLKSSAEFRIIADNAEKIVNALHESDISARNVRCIKGVVCGEVLWYDLEWLKKIAEDNAAQLEICSKRGLFFGIFPYKKRTGLIAGLILAILLVYYFSNIVLRIEVYGNERISDGQIISVLNDYGISVGRFLPAIDLRKTEKKVLAACGELSYVSLRSVGCRVLVEVRDFTDKPEMVEISVPCNIVSAHDAQIIDVKVYSGMLVPMLYDGVRKGELLISGAVDGKLDHDYYVHALGEITGRYNESASFFQPYNEEIRVYDDEYIRKSLYIFGLRVPLYIESHDERLYDYSERLDYVEFLGLTLPFGAITAQYKPYTLENAAYDRTAAEELLNEKIRIYEKNFYDGEPVKIIDRQVTLTETENGLYAYAKFTLEGEIGVPKEIFAKY